MANCLICQENINTRVLADSEEATCPRCGMYRATGTAIEMLRRLELTPRQVSNASGWIRENQGFLINSNTVEKLKQIRTPSFHDRADRLLLNLEKMSDFAGAELNSDITWLSMAWAINDDELSEIVRYLTSVGRLSLITEAYGGRHHVKIGPEGWAHLNSIRNVNSQSTQGFVAMWFNDGMQPIYDTAISIGIERAGYKPHRVDQREHNEKIDDEIIAQIRSSRFVLADFTGHRGGVYYEAGYAKGLGLEVIWTCRKDAIDDLHFDIRQYNCIFWSQDGLEDFSNKIQFRIEAILGRGPH